ncbi:MAG: LysM-like peptidoglycan-binding domain-containing protein, partial [Gammaproteobacteria bacterium]
MKIKSLRERWHQFASTAEGAWRPRMTRTWIGVFAATLVVIGLALGGLDPAPPDASAHARSLDLDLPAREPVVMKEPAAGAALSPTTDVVFTPPEPDSWDEVTVRSGQTLDGIFREQGFSIPLLHEILALNEDTKRLVKIRPGDVFGFQRTADGALETMRYPIDEDAYLLVENGAGGPTARREVRELLTETHETEGRIESSLFLAGKAAGLSDNMIMKLANIFGWDIDFVLDIRAGDRFFLVYEKVYREGEFLRDGEILAATFINQGERFQAIRYEVDGAARYFAPDGSPMRKAFLRAPLNFSYISSNFNPKRFHPILKRIKAHNGI